MGLDIGLKLSSSRLRSGKGDLASLLDSSDVGPAAVLKGTRP